MRPARPSVQRKVSFSFVASTASANSLANSRACDLSSMVVDFLEFFRPWPLLFRELLA
jgi:hypothetical protein